MDIALIKKKNTNTRSVRYVKKYIFFGTYYCSGAKSLLNRSAHRCLSGAGGGLAFRTYDFKYAGICRAPAVNVFLRTKRGGFYRFYVSDICSALSAHFQNAYPVQNNRQAYENNAEKHKKRTMCKIHFFRTRRKQYN